MNFRRAIGTETVASYTLALISVATASTSASAQNLIVDGGFENPILAAGSSQDYTGGQALGSWTVLVAGAITLGHAPSSEPQNGVSSFNPEEGSQAIDLTGPYNEGTTDGVTQSFATLAGHVYSVSFYEGRVTSSIGSGYYSGSPVIDLSINGGSRTSFTNSLVSAPGTVAWQQFTTFFTATSATSMIALYDGTSSSNENYVGLDNVSVIDNAASAPEPGALLLSLPMTAFAIVSAARRRLV